MKDTPLLFIAGLALDACSLGPDLTRPDRPAPGDWSLQAATGNPSHLAAAPFAAQWWTLFDDVQLNALLQRIQRANLNLRSAATRLQQSRAIRRGLGDDVLLSVDASGNYQCQRTTSAGLLDPSSKTGKGNYNHALAGFDVSWGLDFQGRVRRELEAADTTVETSENELCDVQVSVLAEAACDYIQLCGKQSRTTIIRDDLETARRSLELTRIRLANGVATNLEVAQALIQVASMEAHPPEMEKNQAHLINVSGYLVGTSPGSLLAELDPAREIPYPPGSMPVGLPSELAQRHSDIRRAGVRLRAAIASTGVTKASFHPRITLNGGFGFEPLQLSSLGDWDHRQFAIGPVFSLPVLGDGRLCGRLELREAQQWEAAIDYRRTMLRAWQEVDDAMHDYAANQRRQERLGEAAAQNRRALQSVREQYRAGVVDFLSVLDSQRQLLDNQEQQVASDKAVSLTLANPHKALGGGRSPTSNPASDRDDAGRGPAKELEMDLLHGIRTFVRVVGHGSFAQAAQALGTSSATVSRQVAGLEQALSACLLQRNTRSIAVTESGLRYYKHCKQILRIVTVAAADVENSQSHASGRLRLHAVTELDLEYLMPLLVDYLDDHPDVFVNLTLAQGTPAPLEEGLDMLITLGRTLPDSTLIARDLGQIFSAVCAAPGYLARHGVSRTPEDLLRHRCLSVAAPSCSQGWVFVDECDETLLDLDEVLEVNLPGAVCAAATAGLGVCLLPGFVATRVLQEGSLLRLLSGHRLHAREVFVLYPSRRYLGAKIRAWVDFLRERLPLAPERDRATLDDRRYQVENPTGVTRETTT